MNSFSSIGLALLSIVILLWILLWEGLGLWKSARYEQKYWFIALVFITLIPQTYGILDIIYLFFFAKKKMQIEELKFWKYFQDKSIVKTSNTK